MLKFVKLGTIFVVFLPYNLTFIFLIHFYFMNTTTVPTFIPQEKLFNLPIRSIVQLCRILVGVLFIISGLIKSNDTIGFGYKLEEYFEVFGADLGGSESFLGGIMEFFHQYAWEQAFFICVIEVVLGIMLLLGTYIRFVSWSMLLMILFFTALTWYSWTYNKVTDCGCFGDALKLTPKQSFMKDIYLTVMISIIFLGQKAIRPLFPTIIGFLLVLLAIAANIYFPYYTHNHLPVKDFRPYAIGNNWIEKLNDDIDIQSMSYFVYQNKATKDSISFAQTDTASMNKVTMREKDKWQWLRTKDEILKPAKPTSIVNFNLTHVGTNKEISMEVLLDPNYTFLLVEYDLDKANTAVQPAINEFAKQVQAKGARFIALTASANQVPAFVAKHKSTFEYYSMDEKALKTIVRGNPGLVLIKNATAVDMWHWNDFPTFASLKYDVTPKEPVYWVVDNNVPKLSQEDRPKAKDIYIQNQTIGAFDVVDAEGTSYNAEMMSDTSGFFIVVDEVANMDSMSTAYSNAIIAGLSQLNMYVVGITNRPLAEANANNTLQTDFYLSDAQTMATLQKSNVGILMIKNGQLQRAWKVNKNWEAENSKILPTWEEIKTQYHLNAVTE